MNLPDNLKQFLDSSAKEVSVLLQADADKGGVLIFRFAGDYYPSHGDLAGIGREIHRILPGWVIVYMPETADLVALSDEDLKRVGLQRIQGAAEF